MDKMIKANLNFTDEESYKQSARVVQDNLNQLSPIPLRLDLGKYFAEMKEIMPVFAKPDAELMEPPENMHWAGYAIVFGLKFDEKSLNQFFESAKKFELNEKTKKKLYEYYNYVYGEKAKSIEQIISTFEKPKDLLENLTGSYYDVRHYPEENRIVSDSIYSGDFKNQGLMSRFYDCLSKAINLDSINGLQIEDIVEKNTKKMYEELWKNIKNKDQLCEALKFNYVKSPFMRMFAKLGFKDMNLSIFEDKIHALSAKKSDELKFSIEEEKEDEELILPDDNADLFKPI